jgi:catechol 2,3-dioxygenase-like lactoylglutathione lyase family enzyme
VALTEPEQSTEPAEGNPTESTGASAERDGAPEPAGTGKQAPSQEDISRPPPPTLRIRHLVPADPAVLAIPPQAPPSDQEQDRDQPAGDASVETQEADEATGEISDAYQAVSPPPGQPAPDLGSRRVGGLGVTLFVSNLGRSVVFYRDVLGFVQVEIGPGSAVLDSGDGRIVLRRVPEMEPVDRRLVHLLLEVPDVHAAYDDLKNRGVEFVHRPRPVSRYDQLELWSAAFRDPDGHGIALTKWDVRRAG